MCTPSKDTRRRRVYSQIKEEKEEKEKEGGLEEIVNGIYILIEWICELEYANLQYSFNFYMFFYLLFHYKFIYIVNF